jgi:hypothetical protein
MGVQAATLPDEAPWCSSCTTVCGPADQSRPLLCTRAVGFGPRLLVLEALPSAVFLLYCLSHTVNTSCPLHV